MPYGAPGGGGQPVITSSNNVAWDDPGGASPASANSFRSAFVTIEPGNLFTYQYIVQITSADGSNSAQPAMGIEDDAAGLNFVEFDGPIPSVVGNADGLMYYLKGLVFGTPTSGVIRWAFEYTASRGPPDVDPPTSWNPTEMVGWNELTLNANLFRFVVGAINGFLIGRCSGFISQAF